MKKIWEHIKKAFTWLYEKISSWLASVPSACLWNFILASLLTAILAIDFPGAIEWPMVAVLFLGLIPVIVKIIRNKPINLYRAIFYVAGAVVIQILCWCK